MISLVILCCAASACIGSLLTVLFIPNEEINLRKKINKALKDALYSENPLSEVIKVIHRIENESDELI